MTRPELDAMLHRIAADLPHLPEGSAELRAPREPAGATSDGVKDLRREASALKEVVAKLTLENRLLNKSVTADGEDGA